MPKLKFADSTLKNKPSIGYRGCFSRLKTRTLAMAGIQFSIRSGIYKMELLQKITHVDNVSLELGLWFLGTMQE